MSYQSRVQEGDLVGIFYIAVPKDESFFPTGYYNTLEKLYPLLEDQDFKSFQTGYYINGIQEKEEKKEKKYVRLTYFTEQTTNKDLFRAVKLFIKRNNLKQSKKPAKAAKCIKIAKAYGGEQYEFRFRNYLSLQTQIGLEILKSNPEHAKSLMITYRLQMYATNSPVQPHLEPTLSKYSATYQSLLQPEKEQFWTDVTFRPPNATYWDHFLVNLIIGIDWSVTPNPLSPRLSISQINQTYLPEIGFTINPDWTPNV